MARVLGQSPAAQPVDFRGLYFQEKQSLEATLKIAGKLFASTRPGFPVAVAHYGKASPTPESRLRNVLLHHHGVAIIGTDGNVAYVQTHGFPENEFYTAFRKLISDAANKSPGTNAPEQNGGSD